MVSFTHHDAGTSEEDWAASGAATLPELPLDAGELAGLAFIVLAAHPDDESLGAGGLMARLHALGAEVRVLLCTAGEASHPGSPSTTPDQLADLRLREFAGALGGLVPAADWRYLGLPDGKLAEYRGHVLAAIREAAAATGRTADRVVLVAP
ncbi:LmbE family N-acetylglucosaminyl deacetylase [Arthrobacter sp. B3I4]|nr:LmbE family N-acetylglucosaminyl deacetylase [Arthrobacter sp. B3I4]